MRKAGYDKPSRPTAAQRQMRPRRSQQSLFRGLVRFGFFGSRHPCGQFIRTRCGKELPKQSFDRLAFH
jgi:hypothetical protein